MPQLIGIVIVIALGILALTAIAGVIYSGLLWGPVLAVMWVALQQIQTRRIAQFSDPAVRSRLATISFANGKVSIAANESALEQYMTLDTERAGAVVLGLIVAGMVVAGVGEGAVEPLTQMLPREQAFGVAAGIGAVVGPFIAILVGGLRMHANKQWLETARGSLQALLETGAAPLGVLRDIEQTQAQTDQLMKRLTGSAPAGALAQANRLLQADLALVFDQPGEMQQRLQALLTPARQHLQRLEAFAREVVDARRLHGQAVRLAMSISHRSLMGLAEDALAMIDAAPRYIASGDFDKAERNLATAREELQSVLSDPSVFSEDGEDAPPASAGPSAQDCYARLRIDRSVTAQQLEDLWKRLRQTYHPDKGIADHHAYQAVREDVEAVARDRGFTLRGLNDA